MIFCSKIKLRGTQRKQVYAFESSCLSVN